MTLFRRTFLRANDFYGTLTLFWVPFRVVSGTQGKKLGQRLESKLCLASRFLRRYEVCWTLNENFLIEKTCHAGVPNQSFLKIGKKLVHVVVLFNILLFSP